MNANELRTLLVEYRSQVEQAWTAETAHPDFPGGIGRSAGQCGSTSLWLQKRLWIDHGVTTLFAEGLLIARGDSLDHCWLETEDRGLILDLTADQVAIDYPVVCESPWVAWELGLDYVRVISYESVGDPDLLRRMTLLAEAVNA